MDATNAKGENALHKLVQSWKDSRMLVSLAASLPSCCSFFRPENLAAWGVELVVQSWKDSNTGSEISLQGTPRPYR